MTEATTAKARGSGGGAGDAQNRRIAATIRRLAVEAGAETMRYFRDSSLKVERKQDDSPVTAADRAADDLIVSGLEAAFPDIPIVTEERSEGHGAILGVGAQRYFMVDPLDGTKEFVSGRGEYTVNIALIEEGRPLLGAVFAPALDRLFWTPDEDFAVEEREEVRSDWIEPLRRLWVVEANNRALRAVASQSHRDKQTDAFLARYQVVKTTSIGSSLKFCLIAAGEADFYPRFGPTMAWDTAAAHAVLRAAGGRVRRLSEEGAVEEPLSYGLGQLSGEPFANPAFVAYAPSVKL